MSSHYAIAFALLAAYGLITVCLPRFGGSIGFVSKRPRAAIFVWVTGLLLSVTSLTSSLGILIATSLNDTTSLGFGEPWQAAVAQNVLGWLALACIGVITFHLASAGQWLRAERLEYARQAGAVIAHSRATPWGDDVREVPLDRHLISAFPQTKTVLISDFSSRHLSTDEMRAAIEHERAHLTRNHAVVVALTQVAMAAAAGVDASRRFARAVKLAVEFEADDEAQSKSDRADLARAIRKTADDGDPLAELRLQRLGD